jgi:Trypsin-co-occurring domain 2
MDHSCVICHAAPYGVLAGGLTMTEAPTSGIRLADALAELRAELSRARQEGDGKDVRFAAKEIVVEVDFGWTAEASGGVSKWIPFVDLAAKGGADRGSLHKITLSLEIDTGGDPTKARITDPTGPAPVMPTK